MKKLNLFFILFSLTTLFSYGQSIFKSMEDKNHSRLEKILESGESIEQFNKKGLTPLWMAVYRNDTTSVKLLLKYGADINAFAKNGMNPLMVGSAVNSYESVKILIENGADVNWKSEASKNQQPIRFASQGGSLQLVKLLLEKGADMESTPNDKETPLLTSLHAKKYEIAAFYFNNGANVNVIGRDGKCVIHEAIKTKNPKMVKLALKYNAPLDLLDGERKTTWKIAKQSGNKEIKSLIKQALEEKK